MKGVKILVTCILCIQFGVYFATPVLSEKAQISLLTCSPGEQLYSLFGHSAIRVNDPVSNIDVVFNYGTFSFDEDFYYNFSMGKLNYKLSVSSYRDFMAEYQYFNRGVEAQVLILDSAQTQTLFDFLDWNRLPENRYYLYDFFYNNCSSIIRDALDSTLGPTLVFPNLVRPTQPTFRNRIDSFLIHHPWGDFGIDLGLGLPCDKVMESSDYMFLPIELERAIDGATLDGKPLSQEAERLLPEKPLHTPWSITHPLPLFWLLFGLIAILSAIGYRKRKSFLAIDLILFIVYGAVGALIFFLWFITDHTATVNNFNMLWAWPMHWLAIPLLFSKHWRWRYYTVYGAVAALTIVLFPLLPQALHLATIPLMLIVLTRAILHRNLALK